MNRLWLVFAFVISCSAQGSLSPSAFPELPRNIRTDLERRHCKIPQPEHSLGYKGRDNVITGYFAKPGQTDWAVLCEIGGFAGTSRILIYWNGSTNNPTTLGEEKALIHYELTQDGALGANIRAIGTAQQSHMLASYRRYGGPKPPLIDHDGISDGLDGKSSSISYLHSGRWIGWLSSD